MSSSASDPCRHPDVATTTGALHATTTVAADEDGDAERVALAERHGGLSAWAIEGSGVTAPAWGGTWPSTRSWSSSWTARCAPRAAPRRKSDVIDVERAARDALARVRLAQPRTGPQRAALQMLLTTRRAAIAAATTGQRQLRALVITPEPVRVRFRGQSTRGMLATAAGCTRPPAAATCTSSPR